MTARRTTQYHKCRRKYLLAAISLDDLIIKDLPRRGRERLREPTAAAAAATAAGGGREALPLVTPATERGGGGGGGLQVLCIDPGVSNARREYITVDWLYLCFCVTN